MNFYYKFSLHKIHFFLRTHSSVVTFFLCIIFYLHNTRGPSLITPIFFGNSFRLNALSDDYHFEPRSVRENTCCEHKFTDFSSFNLTLICFSLRYVFKRCFSSNKSSLSTEEKKTNMLW